MCVVVIRAEQIRCAARILEREVDWVEARRELWTLEARAARLCAPRQVHNRSILLDAGVVPPDSDSDTAELIAFQGGP